MRIFWIFFRFFSFRQASPSQHWIVPAVKNGIEIWLRQMELEGFHHRDIIKYEKGSNFSGVEECAGKLWILIRNLPPFVWNFCDISWVIFRFWHNKTFTIFNFPVMKFKHIKFHSVDSFFFCLCSSCPEEASCKSIKSPLRDIFLCLRFFYDCKITMRMTFVTLCCVEGRNREVTRQEYFPRSQKTAEIFSVVFSAIRRWIRVEFIIDVCRTRRAKENNDHIKKF